MRVRATRRGGFTMVEMMVAIGVALAVLGIAAAVANSSAFESYKTVGAADKLSQWMLSAKSRALRDKKPIGLRLLVDPATGQAREAVYIEQPDAWKPASENVFLVVQQVIDEGDQRTRVDQTPPTGNLPPDQRRVLNTRVFVAVQTANAATDPVVAQVRSDFGLAAGAVPLVQPGDVLFAPELRGKGYKIIARSPADPIGGITDPSTQLPTYLQGRVTGTYPFHFHAPQPPNNVPYPPASIQAANPAPNPADTNNPNQSTLTAVVELQLAAAPDLDPSAYSKFPWNRATGAGLPPILYESIDSTTNQPSGAGSTPLGPVSMFDRMTNAARELLPNQLPTLVTRGFGVQRAPRPLLGEPNLLLPAGMAVDFSTDTTANPRWTSFPNNLAGNGPYAATFDILFAPGGEVMNPQIGSGLYALLLRDPAVQPTVDLRDTAQFDAAGRMVLVVVYTRTGAIGTQPVDRPPNNPYQFAKDGVNTGL